MPKLRSLSYSLRRIASFSNNAVKLGANRICPSAEGKKVIIISHKCFKGFIYSTSVRISALHEGFSNWRKLRYDSIKED